MIWQVFVDGRMNAYWKDSQKLLRNYARDQSRQKSVNQYKDDFPHICPVHQHHWRWTLRKIPSSKLSKDFILRLQIHIGIYLTAWAPDAGSLKTDTEQSGASVEGLERKLQRGSMAKMAPCIVGSAHHHHLPNPRPLLASSHLLVTQTNT